jgi:hypothetical protein
MIATLVPTSAFVRVDLPAFGRPTKQQNPERNSAVGVGSIVTSKFSHSHPARF